MSDLNANQSCHDATQLDWRAPCELYTACDL